ncbi:hypothetical protein ATE80_13470 [Streptomyces kanasensis]|uniref:DUF3152 domain-containing protein n=1 Tax=Streptomyces kanasensis TaxID=936756 RepID=A0A124ECQ1_9ACTN|nr:hypothetical protein ATE80_13470 [Streptomyces kanasensis]
MGKRGTAAPRKRARRPSGRGRGRSRGPLSRIAPVTLALGILSLGAGAALAHWHADEQPVAAVAPAAPQAPRADRSPAAPAPPETDARPAAPPAAPSPSRPGRAAPPRSVPLTGAGTFTTARATGAEVGTGTLRRYRVQVEDGTGIPAADAAHEIERILAHPRGWAAHGRGRFQLVTEDADFVIRIATPKTADRLCLAQGLDTRGEYNCETTEGVVVNLKRWLLGSPTFTGTPAEYRHLIINHEIGHEIGLRSHMTCPGPGEPAPVMMQQIKGLRGCVSNAWPHDEDGRYITGPIVP